MHTAVNRAPLRPDKVPAMSAGAYLSASGDLVPFDHLDEAEQAFHGNVKPWVVTEFGMTLAEYVCWHWNQVAWHETYFDDAFVIPDA